MPRASDRRRPDGPDPQGRQPAGGGAAHARSARSGQGAEVRSRGLSGACADHLFPALVHDRSGRGRRLVRARDAECRDAAAVRARLPIPHRACRSAMPSSPPDGHHFNTSILVDRRRQDRRQVPQGASARPCRIRSAARLPAPREALLRAGRSRLSGLAHHGRHRRHVHLQRPALAGDLSRDGSAGRGADRARLQHAVGQFAEEQTRDPRSACSITA